MALVAYRKYEVKAEHHEESNRNLQVNIPVAFIRDHCPVGSEVVVNFDSENRKQLVITVSKPKAKATVGIRADKGEVRP
jgi:hypothetical protein